MNRRNFIRFGFAATGAGVVAPRAVLASAAESPMAGSVYFTEDAPGRWSNKVLSHLPNIEVETQQQTAKIRVLTRHTMEEFDHYIVKHILLDKDFAFVDEKMFHPLKDKEPLSEFDIGGYRGRIHVLSVCNQHDTWLNMAEV
jgi:superoxide reductase